MVLITEFWWQFEDYWVGSVSLANHAVGFWSYSNLLTHCATLPRVSEQLIKSWELTFSRILLKLRSWCFKTDHSGSRSVTKTSHVFHISFWNSSVYLWGYICNFLFFIQKLPFFFNYSPQNRRIAMLGTFWTIMVILFVKMIHTNSTFLIFKIINMSKRFKINCYKLLVI